MVKAFSFLFIAVPLFLFSAEFKASVRSSQTTLKEPMTLELTLKNASPQGSPDLSELSRNFSLKSQHQSFNTMIVNGNVSSTTTWKISLLPLKTGEFTIPSISIRTSSGTYSSNPIKIQVFEEKTDASAKETNTSKTEPMTFHAVLSKQDPFKNEPVFYELKLISDEDLANVKIEKLSIDDAIVELNAQPRAYDTIIDGVRKNVIEFSYRITPLKAGILNIPPVIVQGGILVKKQAHKRTFFDDDIDALFSMPAFSQLKPFTAQSKEMALDVKPPALDTNPWLPAEKLTIEEIWDDSQKLQAGEPLIRGFKITALGLTSNQLPSLSDQQEPCNSCKVYTDAPESQDAIHGRSVESVKREVFTIIPQKVGTLTLPEVSITWWDITKNELAVATIPKRVLEILPALETTKEQLAYQEDSPSSALQIQKESVDSKSLMYAVIACLLFLLFATLFWAVSLKKKISRLKDEEASNEKTSFSLNLKTIFKRRNKKAPPCSEKKEKGEKLPDLNPT